LGFLIIVPAPKRMPVPTDIFLPIADTFSIKSVMDVKNDVT